jgi:hypothetical protein
VWGWIQKAQKIMLQNWPSRTNAYKLYQMGDYWWSSEFRCGSFGILILKITTPKYGKYDYISNWRCSTKLHI